MLRFVASTSNSSLRPALLRKVRSNSGALLLPNSERDIKPQIRTYPTASLPKTEAKPEIPFNKYVFFPTNDAALPEESKEIVNGPTKKFVDLVTWLANQKDTKFNFSDTLETLLDLFKQDEVRGKLSREDVLNYASVLNTSTYKNRVSRLSLKMNRDSDQYGSNTLHTDILLKNAIINLADFVSDQRFLEVVENDTLRKLFLAMSQFNLPHELIKLWEHGVNSKTRSLVYLQQNVLSVVLPVAYDEKRFTYEQITKLYEVNCKKTSFRFHELLTSMGKIAIKEGDYKRALDSLEQMLELLSVNPERRLLQRSLAELHLSFIGWCKDVKIAKNFFDKAIYKGLPYEVLLKAPHVASLLENCYKAKEPFDNIVSIWKNAVKYYCNTQSLNAISNANSRYVIVNKKFFSLFFQNYPSLTQESYTKLKEVISIYASIKKVDELFLNNIITNYSWGDKTVFEQLIENYVIHNVERTQVAYRVALKKIGTIEGMEASEIIKYWNMSLENLDRLKFTYIPIADWAALRDATILSQYSLDREDIYLALLSMYKNYHQDERALDRFVKFWMNNNKAQTVARVVNEDEENFRLSIEIPKPEFEYLGENVDYKTIALTIMGAGKGHKETPAEI